MTGASPVMPHAVMPPLVPATCTIVSHSFSSRLVDGGGRAELAQ